jgi:leucyl aminopeptidase
MQESAVVASSGGEEARPIHAVKAEALALALGALAESERRFAAAQGFKAEAGRVAILPDAAGGIGRVLFGLGGADSADRGPLLFGKLATALPPGLYRLTNGVEEPALAALAFALGSYRFERYRKPKEGAARLVAPDGVDLAALVRIRDGIFLARDLINTPANDLSPHDLARAAEALATRYGAAVSVVDGEALAAGFPMLHAVGEGSDRPPCLVDMRWGAEDDPKVTLIGKGIVFDTGGVDIKTASGMALMKKDMGGAANVLGLASMIIDAGLKLRLRVLIPAAENAVSGRAFRPGDILKSRKGLSVEIGNTDAEGRLVLADALALADEEAPALIVTMATLTGAARVALGPELPPYFSDDAAFVRGIEAASAVVQDPVWRLPLWKPYDSWLASKIADLNHIAPNSFAGSIVAALFLRRFVSQTCPFAHFDIFGWNPSARAIGPEGGEAHAIRALFEYFSLRYA